MEVEHEGEIVAVAQQRLGCDRALLQVLAIELQGIFRPEFDRAAWRCSRHATVPSTLRSNGEHILAECLMIATIALPKGRRIHLDQFQGAKQL
jgi:hypothetical protein